MIPQLVTVRHRATDGLGRQFFVPVLPVLLVLSPLLLLALPAGLVACVLFQVRPVGALLGVGRLLCALPGTRFEIEDGHTALLIRIR